MSNGNISEMHPMVPQHSNDPERTILPKKAPPPRLESPFTSPEEIPGSGGLFRSSEDGGNPYGGGGSQQDQGNTLQNSSQAPSTALSNAATMLFSTAGTPGKAGGAQVIPAPARNMEFPEDTESPLSTGDEEGRRHGPPVGNNNSTNNHGASGGGPSSTTPAPFSTGGPPAVAKNPLMNAANLLGGKRQTSREGGAQSLGVNAENENNNKNNEGGAGGATSSSSAARPSPGNRISLLKSGKSAVWQKARAKLEEKGTLRKKPNMENLVKNVVMQNKVETREQTLWREKVIAQLEVEKEWRLRRDGVWHPSKADEIYSHPYFESTIMFCVVANLIIFSVESDVHDPEEADLSRFAYFWWWAELFFFFVYLFDVGLRVARCKGYFWRFYFPPRHLWDELIFNWVDSFCLLTQLIELGAIGEESSAGAAVMFKLLRLLRMSRLRKYEEVVVVFRTTQRVLIEIGPDLLIVSMVMLALSVTLRQYVKYRDQTSGDYSDSQNLNFETSIMPIANTWFRTILLCLRLWLQDNSMPFIDLLADQDWWISVWFILGLLLSGVVLMNIVSGRVTKIMFEVVTEERRRRATVGMEKFLKNLLITNGLLWFDSSALSADDEEGFKKSQLTPAEQIVQHFESIRENLQMDTTDIHSEEDLKKITVKLYNLLLLPIGLLRVEYDEKERQYKPGWFLRNKVLSMPRQAYLNYLNQVEKHMIRKAFIARKTKELERTQKAGGVLKSTVNAKSEQELHADVIRDIEGMVSVAAMNDVYQTLFDEGQMESVAVSLLQIQEEVAHTKRLLDAYVSHQHKDENAPMEMTFANMGLKAFS
ncbi:unnamed protein product [Amoebophrya sp. A120]|nr:unnamed protein product [Amoebophrya sp. A120]|eukprot:GSA120T00006083001.1